MQVVRIIPCLDVSEGRVVKGVNFINLKDAGDPAELASFYNTEGADELVFLDITASWEKRDTMIEVVERVASEVFIPFTVGGGISSLENARRILKAGADKVAVNTAAVNRPDLINDLSGEFGSQCVVLAVDVKDVNGFKEVYIKGGREPTGLDAFKWIQDGVSRGAGELLITSMDRDGTQLGYDTELLGEILNLVPVPVIASGGAGQMQHFLQGALTGASGLLAASVFHFGTFRIKEIKAFLKQHNILVRP